MSNTTAAPSQLTEYSTRMWARRTENSTRTMSATLSTDMTFNSRSILFVRRALFVVRRCELLAAPFEFQDVHKYTQKYMNNVVKRLDRRDRAAPRQTLSHPARDFLETEPLALEH